MKIFSVCSSVARRLLSVSFVLSIALGIGQSAFAQSVLINEIMQNPSAVSDSEGEWFEVHNPTLSPVDIDGWTIKDDDSDSHVITNGGPLIVPADGFLVLGDNPDSAVNGGVIVDYAYGFGFFLSNSSDELVLMDGMTEIDRVEWDNGVTSRIPMALQCLLAIPPWTINSAKIGVLLRPPLATATGAHPAAQTTARRPPHRSGCVTMQRP